MKKYNCCILILTFFFIQNSALWAGSDIVVKSHFSLESTDAFLHHLRKFLIKTDFGDPYEQKLEKPIRIDLGNSVSNLSPDVKNWLFDLQTLLNFNFLESEYELIVEKFSYSVEKFNAGIDPGMFDSQRIEYVTTNYIKGLKLKADRIVFQVNLNRRTQSEAPVSFKIEIIAPEFSVDENLTAELVMKWMTSIQPNDILLNLHAIDIQKLMKVIVTNPDLIDLSFKDIKIPKISIKIGKKVVNFDEEKIKYFLLDRKQDLKKGILTLLHTRQQDRFSNILRDRPRNILLPKTFGFNSEVNGFFTLEKMGLSPQDIVQFDLVGGFCDREVESLQDACPDKNIPGSDRRTIPESDYQKSLEKINKKLMEGTGNIAVSFSEKYLNQVVEATVQKGLWDEMLKLKGHRLGTGKAFVLAEEEGEMFSLYLDIVHELKGARRILVGRSELKFPIKFGISVQIEEKNKIPHLLIKVKKILVDRDILVKGIPEYGLPSTIGTVPRFQGRVLNEIMAEVNTYLNEDLLDLELKELEGTYFKHLEFFSDGLGRGTALIGLDKSRKNFIFVR